MVKVNFLKSLDCWLGRFLTTLLPGMAPGLPQRCPGKILIIRPGGIGDAVHLIPTIQELFRHFPGIDIDILAERRNSGVFSLSPEVKNTFLYDRPSDLLKVLRLRYDVVIDTEQWHRLSAVVARLIRAPVRIGFATNERARLFTHAVTYCHGEYEVSSFLHLLEPLRITGVTVPEGVWLQVLETARDSTSALLATKSPAPFVALFPGASISERRWGAERFHDVARWCLAQGVGVVFVGGGGDREEGSAIVAGLNALNLAGLTSIAETAAILERATVVVSGDSGILHIAVGLDRPTVSLFGPGIAAKWAPRGAQHVVLNKNFTCSPCTQFGTTPPCPHNVRCMQEISVEDVTSAIRTLLPTHLTTHEEPRHG